MVFKKLGQSLLILIAAFALVIGLRVARVHLLRVDQVHQMSRVLPARVRRTRMMKARLRMILP